MGLVASQDSSPERSSHLAAFTRPKLPGCSSFHQLMVYPFPGSESLCSWTFREKTHLSSSKHSFYPKDVNVVPIEVPLLMACSTFNSGVKSPVSPSPGPPLFLSPPPPPQPSTYIPPLPWLIPRQPLLWQKDTHQGLQVSCRGQDEHPSPLHWISSHPLKELPSPSQFGSLMLLHVYPMGCVHFLESSSPLSSRIGILSPCCPAPLSHLSVTSLPFWGLGPQMRERVPGPQIWSNLGRSHCSTLVSNVSPITWFSSCPNWNTIDPEVRETLTRRHEDGEFW